ncbi:MULTISPECIES: DUF2922 domain-containing protein [unclassified Gemella]|uniref:DUF2922 domain-containing protein n=1 Tax=unclassified Gemella TaxID=2624949 RepID=UPI001C059E6A|nr:MULTISPECIES: DUF2922 domain-containing protein [unclassified Gemella]MBU0278192.1 DUF2922 domain-containing protein [Gemella sp. zg-1178]QWQ38851.1 DUF2922 domain-containing protein [Gemella sp. zg-570]
MNKTLELIFTTADDKKYKLIIKNPKESLDKDTVSQVGSKIIATKIFNTSKRVLASFDKAVYIIRQEQVIE